MFEKMSSEEQAFCESLIKRIEDLEKRLGKPRNLEADITGATTFSLILPIKQVPEGAKVKKKGGQVEFIVKDNIHIHPYATKSSGEDVIGHIINKKGCRYLLGANSSISVTSGDTEVVVTLSLDELLELTKP